LGRRISLAEFTEYHEHRYKSEIKQVISSPEEEQENPDFTACLDANNDDEDPKTKKLDIIFPKGNLPFTSEITALNMFPVFLAT